MQVPSPTALVWDVVTDVKRVAGWISIVGGVEELEHLSKYRAQLNDRLGPFRLAADLAIEVTDIEEGSLIGFVADGEDRQVASRILVQAEMRLSNRGDGTEIAVTGQYEVTGKVATLGASMIKTKGNKILDEFFGAVGEELD